MKRILVVEDSSTIRTLIEEALEEHYEIVTEPDGLRGWLRATAAPHPDLVIADLEMPKLDGISMIRRVHATAGCEHIPVIILSSRDRPEHVIHGLRTGARYYLVKPFTVDELRRKVRGLLPP